MRTSEGSYLFGIAAALFVLHCCRWLLTDVVEDTINATHVIYNRTRDSLKQGGRYFVPIRRHGIHGVNGAQRNCVFIGTRVAHHTHGLYWKKRCERHPYLVVFTSRTQFTNEYCVCLADNA